MKFKIPAIIKILYIASLVLLFMSFFVTDRDYLNVSILSIVILSVAILILDAIHRCFEILAVENEQLKHELAQAEAALITRDEILQMINENRRYNNE